MSKAESSTPVSLLHELLRLDANTGRLYWRARGVHLFKAGRHTAEHRCANWNAKFADREAFFTVDMHGYRHGYIFDRLFSAARVVFAMHTGNWPSHHIDHINGVKADDRPINLRDVPASQNMRNRAISSNSSTGVHGVSFYLGKYDAYITVDGKKLNLGRYASFDAAVAARRAAEKEHGYHPNHGRKSNANA